ncbi:MAG TPA: rhomboid family intramembrane serine protease [Mycolicibacterium fallax]|nr:rhomboid family intramembrane serine protease [Mycolicibacterium fallax]HSA41706.1 rhomboid family intramembrane serine protease [Mycobacterium sp.]
MSTPNAPQAPACYRHPHNVARIGCARCGRPICPYCMTAAAVGHQCPDCVREGRRSVRKVRTVFGGRVNDGRPLVTYTLMAVCVAVFVVQQVSPAINDAFALWPIGIFRDGQWYRMVTSAFMHYGPVHLLFNMWALYLVGPALESWLGRTRYGVLYGMSALGGAVLVYLLSPLNTATAGASGAIFGLFGATFVVGKRLNLDVRAVAVLIGINLVITFVLPAVSAQSISWQGHVGGLVAGSLIAAGYAYAKPAQQKLVHAAVPLALAALFVALCWWRTEQLVGVYLT